MNTRKVRCFVVPALSFVLSLAVLLWLWLVVPTAARAQVAAGAINGTVSDSSGGVVPGAIIVLRNMDTRTERKTESNNVGNYVLFQIPSGKYTLEVTKQGFKVEQIVGIVVLVNQTATYDVALQVGATAQSVTVEAAVATIQTSTAELGTAITSRQVVDLPLNTRNFTQLLLQTPGVSPTNHTGSAGWMTNPIGTFINPSVNGQNNKSNFFMLDGMNNHNDYGGAYAVAPVVDAIEEFKVQSHNDEAQFGGVIGGIVNVVTKSGTNTLHGSAWEFLRNKALDARDPFMDAVTPFKQNQFGATVGGPVVLPHYNGRNRTFFFGSYQGFRYRRSAETLYRVPTAAQLSGDLSDIPEQIYNPFTTRSDPDNPGGFIRDPFMCDSAGNPSPPDTPGTPCNKIPSGLLDPGMVAYAQALFPAPIQTSIPNINGINPFSNQIRQDDYSVRIDEMVNPSNSLWFRYSGFSQPRRGAAGYVGRISKNATDGRSWGASWLHVFSPAATMQLALGRNWVTIVNDSSNWEGAPAPADLIQTVGFAERFACSFNYSPSKCIIPGVNIGGFVSGNPSYLRSPASDTWQAKGDFAWVRGRHTFKMGFDIARLGFSSKYGKGATDNFVGVDFSSYQTANLATGEGGNDLASFLLGLPDGAGVRSTLTYEHGGWVDGFYFQDSVKATDKLTINLGVRYDLTLHPLQGTVEDGNIYIGNIDLNTGNYVLQAQPPSCEEAGRAPCIPTPGGVLPDHVVVTSQKNGSITRNSKDNWQPRVGLAYRLSPKTALRASFGMFFDNWAAVMELAQDYTGSWPAVSSAQAGGLNSTVPTVTAQDPLDFGFGSEMLMPAPHPFDQVQWYIDPLWKNAYSEQWNLGIQHQLTSNTLLTANYVGSHSSRLDLGPRTNVALTPGPGDPAERRPFPYITPTYYDASIGKSNYNALQVAINKASSQGLAYLVSYTWSKAIDMGCSGFFGVEGCSVQNPYDLEASRSVAEFDLRHMLTVSMVYELPVGPGKRFKTDNRIVNGILGNWQLNAIATYTSGIPFTATLRGDIANIGAGSRYMRPDLVSNNVYASNQSPANWLNKAAFAIPALYTFGNVGRNTLRADSFKNLDLSIFRDFKFTESKKLQFRVEMFNLTNTPTWGVPDAGLSSTSFGQIFGTRSTERQIQFALKLYF